MLCLECKVAVKYASKTTLANTLTVTNDLNRNLSSAESPLSGMCTCIIYVNCYMLFK